MWSKRDHHNQKMLQKVFGSDKESSKRQTIANAAAAFVIVIVIVAVVHWNKSKEIM